VRTPPPTPAPGSSWVLISFSKTQNLKAGVCTGVHIYTQVEPGPKNQPEQRRPTTGSLSPA
jgi:hypothetical protein